MLHARETQHINAVIPVIHKEDLLQKGIPFLTMPDLNLLDPGVNTIDNIQKVHKDYHARFSRLKPRNHVNSANERVFTPVRPDQSNLNNRMNHNSIVQPFGVVGHVMSG
jgi:hypothetical protein